MPFVYERMIKFADVDPAGIVFYPRYFEMINETVEEWFRCDLCYSFSAMTVEQRRGVPLVHIDVDFRTPGRLYDALAFRLTPVHMGKSSLKLEIDALRARDILFTARLVIVHIDLNTQKSASWTPALRATIEAQMTPRE